MIHNASGMVWGDKQAMRDTADLLEKVEGSIVHDYTAKTGKEAANIVNWMDAETWFTADEAIAEGFCDRLAATAEPKAKNAWNLSAFTKAPQALLDKETNPTPSPASPNTPEPTGTAQTNTNALRLAMIV
jgi:hypothetical protein